MEKSERERKRENGIKKSFFRDYSPPLIAPRPFRPLSGGRVMKGQTDERRERWRRMRRPIAAHCREQRKGLVTFGS